MTTRNHLAKISLTRKYGWNLLLSFKKNNNSNAKRRCKNYKMTPIDVLLDTLTKLEPVLSIYVYLGINIYLMTNIFKNR